MKKVLFTLCFLIVFIYSNAEQTVGSYVNSYFSNKEYTIEAAQKNGKLQSVYIGIESDNSKSTFISVDGDDLELFKTALELSRDKFLEWVKIAKENNVTEMRKELGIKFPKVTIAWYGTKWWFSFGERINLKFVILDDGKMIATWSPKVTSSSNRYIDKQIYFVFADAEDFNSLISQLNPERILSELLNTKNNEELFK